MTSQDGDAGVHLFGGVMVSFGISSGSQFRCEAKLVVLGQRLRLCKHVLLARSLSLLRTSLTGQQVGRESEVELHRLHLPRDHREQCFQHHRG